MSLFVFTILHMGAMHLQTAAFYVVGACGMRITLEVAHTGIGIAIRVL